MKLLSSFTIGFLFMQSSLLFAQENPFYSYKREIGTNVTKLLGNMLSITPTSNSEPYALQFAYHFPKNTLRLGVNGNSASNTSIDVSSPNPLTKTIVEKSLSARICYERHLSVGERFQLNYGLDGLIGTLNTQTATSNFFNRNIDDKIVGGGPALRFSFKLNKRIQLQTETTLYGRYINKKESVSLSGVPSVSTSVNDWDVKLQLPAQLFINIEF